MNECIWSGFPTSDIGYPIKSDRRTTSDKLYITQLLPTEYSINITNRFGGYQYNKQWMYVYDQAFWRRILDIRLNQIGGLHQISSISLNLGEWAIASHGMYKSHQVFSAAESGKYKMIPPVHSYNLRVCSSKSIQWLLRYEGFGLMAKTLYAWGIFLLIWIFW